MGVDAIETKRGDEVCEGVVIKTGDEFAGEAEGVAEDDAGGIRLEVELAAAASWIISSSREIPVVSVSNTTTRPHSAN